MRSSFGRLEDSKRHVEKLNRMYLSTVETLATAIDAKDEVTHGHIRRVQAAAVGLAREIGITDGETLKAIEAGALLHDTGKIAVPEHILNKPGKLTAAEFEKMKLHAPIGAEILASIDFPYPVVPIVRHHHENWDGTGYPDRISGTDIPVGARILSVVDCFDALTSDRPYRSRMTNEAAIAILTERRGTMYDPAIVDAFIAAHARLMPAETPMHPAARAVGGARSRERMPAADAPSPTSALESSASEEVLGVSSLARALGGDANLADAGALSWMMLKQVLPCSSMGLFVPDERHDILVGCYAAGNHAALIRGLRASPGDGIVGWVAGHRRTATNAEPALDFGLGVASLQPPLLSALAVPLLHDGALVAVLSGLRHEPRSVLGGSCAAARSPGTKARCFDRVGGAAQRYRRRHAAAALGQGQNVGRSHAAERPPRDRLTRPFPFARRQPTLPPLDIVEPASQSAFATEAIGPVPGEERITVIDCLRGAALFGILTANVRGFAAPIAAYEDPTRMWSWPPDLIMQAVVDWLISGKFITIFAALFGIGFAIQMDRAAARHQSVTFYARRMAALFLIGLVHGFGLWWGDILTTYAVCGFMLLNFRNMSQRAILRWAHVTYWFLVVLYLGFYISTLLGAPPPPAPDHNLQRTIDIYSRGTFSQIFVIRAEEWWEANSFVFFLTRILGVFLYGLYIWRQGYLLRPSEYMEWWKRVQRIGLSLGLAGNLIGVALEWAFNPNPMRPTMLMAALIALQSFSRAGPQLGVCGHDRAVVAGSSVAAAPPAVFLRGQDGAHELPPAVADLYDDFLQLWPGTLRPRRSARRLFPRDRHLRGADSLQPVVAEHAPLRPDGVGLASPDLRPRHRFNTLIERHCLRNTSIERHCFRSSLIFFSALSRTSVFKLSDASASRGIISSAFSA